MTSLPLDAVTQTPSSLTGAPCPHFVALVDSFQDGGFGLLVRSVQGVLRKFDPSNGQRQNATKAAVDDVKQPPSVRKKARWMCVGCMVCVCSSCACPCVRTNLAQPMESSPARPSVCSQVLCSTACGLHLPLIPILGAESYGDVDLPECSVCSFAAPTTSGPPTTPATTQNTQPNTSTESPRDTHMTDAAPCSAEETSQSWSVRCQHCQCIARRMVGGHRLRNHHFGGGLPLGMNRRWPEKNFLRGGGSGGNMQRLSPGSSSESRMSTTTTTTTTTTTATTTTSPIESATSCLNLSDEPLFSLTAYLRFVVEVASCDLRPSQIAHVVRVLSGHGAHQRMSAFRGRPTSSSGQPGGTTASLSSIVRISRSVGTAITRGKAHDPNESALLAGTVVRLADLQSALRPSLPAAPGYVGAALGLRGLYNMGNTCFASVIFQALVHNPMMRAYFLSELHTPQRCAVFRQKRAVLQMLRLQQHRLRLTLGRPSGDNLSRLLDQTVQHVHARQFPKVQALAKKKRLTKKQLRAIAQQQVSQQTGAQRAQHSTTARSYSDVVGGGNVGSNTLPVGGVLPPLKGKTVMSADGAVSRSARFTYTRHTHQHHNGPEGAPALCLACFTDRFFQKMFSGKTIPCAPGELLSAFWLVGHSGRVMGGGAQHDSQEFFLALLHSLHRCFTLMGPVGGEGKHGVDKVVVTGGGACVKEVSVGSMLQPEASVMSVAAGSHSSSRVPGAAPTTTITTTTTTTGPQTPMHYVPTGDVCGCVVHSVFAGLCVSVLTCSGCQHASIKEESFVSLSLPLNCPERFVSVTPVGTAVTGAKKISTADTTAATSIATPGVNAPTALPVAGNAVSSMTQAKPPTFRSAAVAEAGSVSPERGQMPSEEEDKVSPCGESTPRPSSAPVTGSATMIADTTPPAAQTGARSRVVKTPTVTTGRRKPSKRGARRSVPRPKKKKCIYPPPRLAMSVSMRKYFAQEELAGKVHCARCECKQSVRKQIRIVRPPRTLVLHMKRMNQMAVPAKGAKKPSSSTTTSGAVPNTKTKTAVDPGTATTSAAVSTGASTVAPSSVSRGTQTPETKPMDVLAANAPAPLRLGEEKKVPMKVTSAPASAQPQKMRSYKDHVQVEFPLEGLDISAYCLPTRDADGREGTVPLYDLFCAVVHRGVGPFGGHFVAYVRTGPLFDSKSSADGGCGWCLVDDHKVIAVTETEVRCAQAYMLFYQQR